MYRQLATFIASTFIAKPAKVLRWRNETSQQQQRYAAASHGGGLASLYIPRECRDIPVKAIAPG
jgi:hypothetical protein